MKKITMMAFLLAALAPVAQVWAGGSSKTYYAALKAQVSSSGGGKVYASDSSSTPSDSSFNANSSTKQSSGSSSGFTFYAHAKANEGYRFAGWTGDATSSDNPCKVSVTATSTSSSSYTTKTVTANFEQLPPATVTFVAPNNGSYTINGEAANAQLVKANQPVPYSVTLVATPAENFRFAGWYVLENGSKSFFSTDATTTRKFDVDATVGAEFIPDGYAIYAAVAAKGYGDLATALAEAQSGEAISVYSSTALNTSAAVPFGVSLTVASGVTLTVASGATLYIDGSVSVNGTISGMVSKCTRLIKQVGQADGVPLNPYGTVKYWKTSISTPSISVSSSQTHMTIVNGLGEIFRPTVSSSAKLIRVKKNASVAVNHITGFVSESTSVNIVNNTVGSDMVILLGGDCVINGGLTSKTGFAGVVDCAGNNCVTVSGVEVSGNNGKCTLLNCPSFTGRKVINITHDYFNCSSVTLSSFNAGGSPILNFYDCGALASPASFSASFSKGPTDTTKFNFYSGYYNSLSYKTCYKVYGGSYKSNPSSYIADTDGFEAVYDSGTKYYNVQEKVAVVNVVAINGTEYASLSDAISAASKGATISLIEAVDLAGTTVTIPSGKTVTLAVDKHSINSGKIVNNGTLLITDATIENEGKIKCDIENNGTLDLVFGTYSGAIVNKLGILTTHNGVFTGTLTKNGGTVNLNGGHFAADPSELVATDGYIVVKDSEARFCVCELPDGTMSDTLVSGAAGYGATPYTDADFSVLNSRVKNGKTKRSEYSDANWKRLAELLCFYQVYYNNGLDATLKFDRDVAAHSINLYAKSTVSTSVDFKFDLPAGELYRALSETVIGYGYYAKTYYSLFDENIKSVAMAVTDKSGNNAGTVCTAMVELWESVRASDYSSTGRKETNTVFIAGSKRFTIGAGANKAMIRPETGAARFFSTVTDALAAAEDGEVVMLTQDCEEEVVLAGTGTFTIDKNGFELAGAVTAADGFFIEAEEAGSYTVAKKSIQMGDKMYGSIQEVVEAAREVGEVTVNITEDTKEQEVELTEDVKTIKVVADAASETVVTVKPPENHFVEVTVVEAPDGEQSGATKTTVYEAKKITEEVVTVTEETVVELDVKLEEFQTGSTETKKVEDVAKIVEAVNNLMENEALKRADNVEQAKSETINLKAIVITPKEIVQEVQDSATENEAVVVTAATFDVTPKNAANEKINGTEFTFRLPVADGISGSMVVFHENEYFGNYPVLSWNDGDKVHKYIEVTSSEFSHYSYELLSEKNGAEYAVATIGESGFYGSLAEAFEAANNGDTVVLRKDTTLVDEIAVAKTVTLDLNGHTAAAADGKSAIQVAGGALTIDDTVGGGGITAANGCYAVYTDFANYPVAKAVTINGGTFSSVRFNKYPIQTTAVQSGEARTPTTVAVNGGTFTGGFSIYRCPTTIAGGTFEKGLDTSVGSVSVYSNSKTPVNIAGGKFKTEPINVGGRVIVAAGYYEGGWYYVNKDVVCQAVRNGKNYRYASEAFAVVGADTKIALNGDVDLSGISVTLGEGQSLTVSSSLGDGWISAADGLTLVETPNSDYTVTYTVVRDDGAVARIGGVYYATLDEAFSAVTGDVTITLVADAELGVTKITNKVTLALAAHNVEVTTRGIDLDYGKLTVTGIGCVSTIPTVTKKVNFVIAGGTWGANPSSYVPEVVTALPGEQSDIGWRNDRYYVFAGWAFIADEMLDVPAWSEVPGYWTVVPLPKAYVTTMEEEDIPSIGAYGKLDCAYRFESFSSENGDDALAATYLNTGDFSEFTSAQIARAKELLLEKTPFLGWDADFVVSLDGDAEVGDLALSGYYDDWGVWVTYESPRKVQAGDKIRLLTDVGKATPGDWPYANICRFVRTFDCGANMVNPSLAGKTMTVQLRLYKPDEDRGLGSPSILVCEYKYTFGDDKAARIVRDSAATDYATLAEALAEVQSNETIIVLNDFSGNIDLAGCKTPFTIDVNGFGWDVGEVTVTEENWEFRQLSNRSCSYYEKPTSQEDKKTAAMVEVVAENGETVTLSPVTIDEESELYKAFEEETQGTETTVEEYLDQKSDNGLKNWQNYVLGQDPSAAVRVDGGQGELEETPVVNTLAVNVPADSGFTVTYEIDKVAADGTFFEVVDEKPNNEAFSIDISKVETNAYFKLTAVITADDGSGATKVSSENTIGVLKVDSAATNTIIAVPWSSLSGGSISVSNLVRTATLKEGDKITAYDSSTGTYLEWVLDDNGIWQSSTTIHGSGVEESSEASEQTIPRGAGVWLTRTDPENSPIYLVGEATDAPAASELAAADPDEIYDDDTVKPTWNLVASPSVEATDVAELLDVEGRDGDKIIVHTDTAPKNYTKVNGVWGYDDIEVYTNAAGRVRARGVRRTDTKIPAGTGFWYLNSSTEGNKKLNWK